MSDLQAQNDTQGDASEWLVRLGDGRVRVMSLDELDEAFQGDLVNADTEVLEDGSTEWKRLGELLGLEEEAASVEASELLEDAEAAGFEPAPVAGYPPAAASPVRSAARGTLPGYPAPQGPTVAQAAPVASMPPAPISAAAYSTAPVTSTLEDDDWQTEAPFKKRRTGLYVTLAALVVCGVGVGVVASRSSGETAAAAASPPVEQPAAPVQAAAPVVAPSVAPEPVKAAPPEARLNDDTKRALSEADKKREKLQNQKQKKQAGSGSGSSRSKSTSSSPFTKGGDRYDPLNAKL